jgi:hypothetical protein
MEATVHGTFGACRYSIDLADRAVLTNSFDGAVCAKNALRQATTSNVKGITHRVIST